MAGAVKALCTGLFVCLTVHILFIREMLELPGDQSMATNYDALTDGLKEFIARQKIFFVGTAPSGEGEVHIAPKGYDILRILDDRLLVYLDYYGSGNDTALHLAENGKITLMWCSFDSQPCILRVFGKGEVLSKGTEDFAGLLKICFPDYDEAMVRQLFRVTIHRAMTSCGNGVPFMKYEDDRMALQEWSEKEFLGRF